MKISIFGSYNGGSIGDTAILLGLISSIYRVLGEDVDVTVLTLGNVGVNEELEALGVTHRVREVAVNRKYSGLPLGCGKGLDKIWRYSKRLMALPPLNINKIKKILRGSNVLLVGGGNLVMDIFERWPRVLKTVCCLSKDLGVPYYFVGVGSAPISTIGGKSHLLESLKLAHGVFFRDRASKEYCETILGFDRSSVGPDLAFGIECSLGSEHRKENALLLNLASVYSDRWPVKDSRKYEEYLSNMVDLVDRLIKKLGIKEVVVFNTNYPLDEFASDDFLEKYGESSCVPVSLRVVRGKKSVAQLLNICSKAKFSLVTRLHAGIISKISGAHVLAIEYQPKVRDVLGGQTSTTMIESFESLLSGAAFSTIKRDFPSVATERDFVGENEVDRLLERVFNHCLETTD